MRIGVAALGNLSEDTGGKNYISHFFKQLTANPSILKNFGVEEIHLFLSEGETARLEFIPTGTIRITEIPNSRKTPLHKIFAEQFQLPKHIGKAKIDLMYFPGNFISIPSSIPSVVNIRGMAHYYGKEYGVSTSRRLIRKPLMSLSAKRAKAIISPSEDIKKDVVRFTGVQADKITVIPHGVDLALFDGDRNRTSDIGREFIQNYKLDSGKYILYASALWPYKNHATLIEAFKQLLATYPEMKLVIAGKGTGLDEHHLQHLYRLPEQLNIASQVVFTGGLPQHDLRYLYAHARAFVFPSLYESFGNPIFEAWASAVPVAASNVHSFPEVVQDAALLFDPHNASDILRTLLLLVGNESVRKLLVAKGSDRAKQFSWKLCVERTLSLLHSVSR